MNYVVSGDFFTDRGNVNCSAYQHPGRGKYRAGVLTPATVFAEIKEAIIDLRPFTVISFNELNANVYVFDLYFPNRF